MCLLKDSCFLMLIFLEQYTHVFGRNYFSQTHTQTISIYSGSSRCPLDTTKYYLVNGYVKCACLWKTTIKRQLTIFIFIFIYSFKSTWSLGLYYFVYISLFSAQHDVYINFICTHIPHFVVFRILFWKFYIQHTYCWTIYWYYQASTTILVLYYSLLV